jgi:hypothetical protein
MRRASQADSPVETTNKQKVSSLSTCKVKLKIAKFAGWERGQAKRTAAPACQDME